MIGLRALAALAMLFACAGAPAAADEWAPRSLSCEGIAKQGGLLRCAGPANTGIDVSGPDGTLLRTVMTDPAGHVLIGLQQDEPSSIRLETVDRTIPPITLTIAPRNDDFRVLRNLQCDKVDARTEAQKQHAIDSWVKKQAAFDSFNRGPTVGEGFVLPAEGPMSSPFGPTRKYIGTREDGTSCERVSVHEGYDIKAPVGTPVYAPAAGTIVLADPDLYYEGGTIFLDHGGGLMSVFLHLSEVAVEPGTFVPQGDEIGKTGNTGRTTGPHLHWAVKWRNPVAGTRDGDFYIDPGLLLSFPE